MIDDIRRYLKLSGLVPQSVEALEPDLLRWERHLRQRGVNFIPPLISRTWCSPTEARAHNELALLLAQGFAERQPWVEHELRNLVGIRPYKA
jgi:hypothetical protein